MPAPVRIEITGLKELRARFAEYPRKLDAAMRKTLEASLYVLTESTPPYPAPPSGSDYVRTGTLGRTLGAGQGGGKAEIFEVKALGSGGWSGDWGTRLKYAPYVIGASTQARHMGHWWTIVNVARKASPKINKLFEIMANELAKYLERDK